MTEWHELPRITIPAADHERLIHLAETARSTNPDIAEYLARELNRADIGEGSSDGARIRMGSRAEYRDEGTQQTRSIRVVYPFEADPGAGRISVLTPIGAALIGLSKGQSIDWSDRSGKPRRLTVLKVEEPGAVSLRYRDM